MSVLLQHGADPNRGDDRGNQCLGHIIVHKGGIELLELLVGHGGDLQACNGDEFGLLHAASETNRADVVPWLHAKGLDVEARTRHGHTPLHIACALGNLDAAKALFEAGADPQAKGPRGESLREIAVSEEQDEAVQLIDSWTGSTS